MLNVMIMLDASYTIMMEFDSAACTLLQVAPTKGGHLSASQLSASCAIRVFSIPPAYAANHDLIMFTG
jgi:hypothetical protein